MTIFALSSGSGRTGVAVIRMSGPGAGDTVRRLAGRLPPPRRASLAKLIDQDGAALDQALVLWFPGPASFTGEDCAEFHVHGGRAVVAGVLAALARMPGLRPAEAGEFTRRAFLNGRIDLTAAEGLADLIAADTAEQRKRALRQMGGELADLYGRWHEELLRILAHLEADLDFSDEDLPDDVEALGRTRILGLLGEISQHIDSGRCSERLREGVQIVILGAPNVGKSSLMNLLARRDVAIVSDIAGTTRDVIDVHLDLGGYPATITDTAGLRESDDQIELEGMRRATARAESADLRVLLCECANWPDLPPELARLRDDSSMVVWTKADLGPTQHVIDAFALSVKTGQGIDAFLAALTERVRILAEAGDAPSWTRLRHRLALEDCAAALQRYGQVDSKFPELAAEEIRLAMRALGRLTGRVDVEDILDIVFRDFCIGK